MLNLWNLVSTHYLFILNPKFTVMADQKNPGIVINFNAETSKFKVKDFAGAQVICSESAENEIELEVRFKIKVKGLLKPAPFDPNEIDPIGENHLYLPFDNADEKSINYLGFNSIVNVLDPDPGSAPAMLSFGFPNSGKTRWGKKRWGMDFKIETLKSKFL